MKAITLAVSLLLGSSLLGQVVSPRHFTRVEANSESYDPLASTQTQFQYLQVHDDLVGTPRTINRLAFRMSDSETTAPIIIQASLIFSEAAPGISASNLSTTFAANHGAGRTTVANGVFFNFPAVTYDAARDLWPRAFSHQLVLPVPYQYQATAPLVWEINILSRQNLGGRGRFDLASGSAVNPSPWFVTYTARTCGTNTGATRVALSYGDTAEWSQARLNFSLGARFLLPNQLSVAMLGLSNTTCNGLPLPLLIPGSDTAPSGPCFLATCPVLQFAGVSNASGTFAFASTMPLLPSANGSRLFMQTASLAPAANPLGVVTSEAAYIQVLAPYGPVPVGMVTLPGQIGTTGRVYPNHGLVVEVR